VVQVADAAAQRKLQMRIPAVEEEVMAIITMEVAVVAVPPKKNTITPIPKTVPPAETQLNCGVKAMAIANVAKWFSVKLIPNRKI
jgi:hypothetical protein